MNGVPVIGERDFMITIKKSRRMGEKSQNAKRSVKALGGRREKKTL
jgi:hypothetical protein